MACRREYFRCSSLDRLRPVELAAHPSVSTQSRDLTTEASSHSGVPPRWYTVGPPAKANGPQSVAFL
jgi:hypothetical protein